MSPTVSVPLASYSTRRLLRASARAHVYEAVRKRDDKRVVAKVFELGDDGVEARVEHEFRLLQQLDVVGVVRALGVERAGDRLVLLLDYVDGVNLAQFADGQPIDVDVFLPKALSLVATLGRVHERRIVHRDIKPSNVLVEAATGDVFLADFGISVLLESERQHLFDPEVIEGTLPYVSPEQTGRTTREVDFRSDLYSLGATFYELLTGRRPFEANEPLELIHAHLARRPTPPDELNSSLPAQLSAIVMKLLEKAPEHRYQSAGGLHADLERCAQALATGDAQSRFELGGHDHPSTLQLPHQLYGRTRERDTIERALAAVSESSQRRMVLISGAPGLGKTALLRTIDTRVDASGGHMAFGKFEHHQVDVPYRGFISAFTSLIEQVLTRSDEQLGRWRRTLKQALGPIAGVVAAMVPELALVLGELPPVPTLELGESRNRLHVALTRFVSGFAREGPLVLVLDDLQWADPASLELLRVLWSEGGESPVLFVGAYRSGEVDDEHPLRRLLDSVETTQVGAVHDPRVSRIELQPLGREDLEQLLADVLGRPRVEMAALAQLVARKTASNPLFIRQFLLHIEQLQLLRPTSAGWQWDPDEIAAAGIPDDVVEVMRARLDRLHPDSRELLALAACVGSRFDVALLEALGDPRRSVVLGALHDLEQQGLVSPSGSDYVFSHERIRAVARDRIEPETRRSLDWEIGDYLLARYSRGGGEDGLGERVFEVVDHLDAGLPIERMPEPRRQLLVRLNLQAGQRALDSAAWAAARAYFDLGVELLAGDLERSARASGPARDQAFAAAFGQAQAMAVGGHTDQAEAAFERLLGWELTIVERARVLGRQVRILELRERPAEALAQALSGLAALGCKLPRASSKPQMILAIIRATRSVKGATRKRFRDMPVATDEREIAIMHLLAAAIGPAWLAGQELWVIIVCTHLQTLMRAGYHPTAGSALGSFAMLLMSMGKADEAREMVDSAVELATARESTPAARVSARSNSLVMVGPQCRAFREVAEPMEAAHAEAIEVGERYVAGLIGSVGLVNHLEAGTHLREILEIDARVRSVDESFGGRELQILAEMFRRLLGCMIGTEGASLMRLDDVASDEISPLTRYVIITSEVWGRMLLGDAEQAWTLAQQVLHDYERVLLGSIVVPRFAMLAALLAARRCSAAGASERRRLVAGIRKRLRTIRRFARLCPENYQAMADIVAGELASLRGQADAALRMFERAHAAALESGAHYVAALASVSLATWAKQRGLASTELGAQRSAREAYERMGARALVEQLDREHGRLASHELPPLERSSMTQTTMFRGAITTDGSGQSLDVATVLATMQVMQAISEDLELGQVITRVLASAIEHAGADRGVLMLDRGGEFAMVAEGEGRETAEFMANPVPLRDARDRLATSVVLYVVRTGGSVVVDDIAADSRFSSDPYVVSSGVRSLLCMPILKQTKRIGALMLENRLAAGAFTGERLEILRILLAQAASALDNSRLYAALARSEAQWRSLVDGVPDVIALMDAHGQLEFVNHLSPYDADPSQLIGRSADAYLDPASKLAWRDAFDSVVAGRAPREVELCVAPEGHPRRHYMTRIVSVGTGVGAGAQTKYLTISTDISERKGLEAQLRQQQRLDSLGTLASGVAHEINNPVQGILNYAELIYGRAEDPATVREFSREITNESERVATIVRNLLAFSRQEREQQREDVSVSQLVEATLSLIQAVIRKDYVRVALELPDELPLVSCRAQQIQQIIMNLVTNARDALNDRYSGFHDDKVVEISARGFDRDGRSWLRLTIADRGTGIPEDVCARIFDPFFTTKGRDQGTGLGLAVSHGIALEHGGDLRVESEVGVGTRFHLELPIAAELAG
ncbi:AAA family ATPase [Enhygromyxa salina]|uniref:histidine kinase n=1 Tax=Enhygromyxa salina TaxID=215803 RepID=A0A2S9Y2U3_9BACT|nr:AAA family ATPase [Enhygromyxa salina]PRP99310.1 Sporulation kinase E [Enhygromyxa salina]